MHIHQNTKKQYLHLHLAHQFAPTYRDNCLPSANTGYNCNLWSYRHRKQPILQYHKIFIIQDTGNQLFNKIIKYLMKINLL